MNDTDPIEISVLIDRPVDQVWEIWTYPIHIKQWNFANDDWHCPDVINNVEAGGHFSWRMEAKDGSMGFDYSGRYLKVVPAEEVLMTLDDGREVHLIFREHKGQTEVVETFESDKTTPREQQKMGWQAILDNLKAYAESEHSPSKY